MVFDLHLLSFHSEKSSIARKEEASLVAQTVKNLLAVPKMQV